MTEGELKKRIEFKIFPPGVCGDYGAYRYVLLNLIDEAKKEIFEAFDTSRVETWHKLKKWFGT